MLALIAEDRTDRQIAGPLFISSRTVAIHVSCIPARIGVTSRRSRASAPPRRLTGRQAW